MRQTNITHITQKFQVGEMFSIHKEITPQKAQEILALMPRNRRPHIQRVKEYAKLMMAGKWDHNHPQGLVFNKEGNLINGQHRLLAVIESGETVGFYCTFNADDACIVNLDNGVARSTDQTGVILGLETDRLDIAIAKCLCIQIGKPSPGTRSINGQKALELFEKYQDSIRFAKQKKSSQAIVSAPIRATIARAHYNAQHNSESIAHGKQDLLESFIEVLDTGYSTGLEQSAAISLRNIYLGAKEKRNPTDAARVKLAARTVTALVKFLNQEPTRNVHEAKAQIFVIGEDNE